MSNIFDQFDDLPQGPAPAPSGNVFDQFDPEAQAPVAEATPEPGFVERAQGYTQDAATSIVDRIMGPGPDWNAEDPMGGPLGTAGASPAEVAQTATAETLVAGSNILLDGGLTLLDAIVPDSIQDTVKNYSRAAWDKIASNETIKEGIRVAGEGYEAYQAWAKENPEYAQRVEEVIEVGSLGRKPGVPNKRGTGLKRKADRDIRNNRRAQVNDLLEPVNRQGQGQLQQTKRGTTYYEPSLWEQEVNNEVMKIRDVKPRRSAVYNRNVIRDKAVQTREQLETYIQNKGNPAIDKDKMLTGLANKVNAIDEDTLLTGDARAKAIKMYGKARELILESDGTAQGILQARRDFDQWVRRQKGNVFDSDLETALTVANKEIRDGINDAVEKAAGPKVRTLLDKQHKLLSASDTLDAKTWKEANTRIGRLKQKIEGVTGMKYPTTPLAAGATVAAGGAFAAGYPMVAAALGGVGGGILLIKALKSPRGPKLLGELMELMDTYPQLSPEINAIIQMAEELGDESDDGTAETP